MKKFSKKIKTMVLAVVMLFGVSIVASATYYYGLILSCKTVYFASSVPIPDEVRLMMYDALEIIECGGSSGGSGGYGQEEGHGRDGDITDDEDGSTCLN